MKYSTLQQSSAHYSLMGSTVHQATVHGRQNTAQYCPHGGLEPTTKVACSPHSALQDCTIQCTARLHCTVHCKTALYSALQEARQHCTVHCNGVDCTVVQRRRRHVILTSQCTSVDCRSYSVECRVWSVECRVWSVECRV